MLVHITEKPGDKQPSDMAGSRYLEAMIKNLCPSFEFYVPVCVCVCEESGKRERQTERD